MGKVKLEELVVELTAENKQLVNQLKASQQVTDQASKRMAKSVGDFADKSSKSVSGFQKVFQTALGFFSGQLLIDGFNAMKNAATSLFKSLITDGVAAAQAQEDAIVKLNSALNLAGRYSKETSLEIQAFASSLQATSKYGDEAIIETGALIESLGQLDKDGLKKATAATLDMASALGIDLKAAATLVGKAATGEISSFTRYGVVIEKGATAAETFSNTLDALNEKFGGSAAAQLKSYSGSVQQVKNSWGDLTEEIGFVITSNMTVLEIFGQVNKDINAGSGEIKNQRQAYQELLSQGIIGVIEGVNVLIAGMDSLGRIGNAAFQVIWKTANDASYAINKVLALLPGNTEAAQAAADALKESAKAAAAFDSAFTEDTKLSKINDLLFGLEDSARAGFEAVKTGAEGAAELTAKAKDEIEKLTEAQKKQAEAGRDLAKELILGMEDDSAAKQELRQAAYEQELADLQAARDQQMITEEQYQTARKGSHDNFLKQQLEDKKKAKKAEDDLQKQQLADMGSFFGSAMSMSRGHSRGVFELAKGAATGIALMKGYQATQEALAMPPGPPVTIPSALATAAQAAANVAAIRGTGFRKGIDEVPGVGFNDSFPAMLAPKERVVPAETNKDLKQFLSQANGDGGGMSGTVTLRHEYVINDQVIEIIEQKLIRNGRINVGLTR